MTPSCDSLLPRYLREGSYPLLTLGHLARETETEWGYLRSVVERELASIRQSAASSLMDHSERFGLHSPSLMHVQRWILANVLSGLSFMKHLLHIVAAYRSRIAPSGTSGPDGF